MQSAYSKPHWWRWVKMLAKLASLLEVSENSVCILKHVLCSNISTGPQPKYTSSYLSHTAIGLMSRVFANGLGDQGSIPGWAIPKTQKNGNWCHLAPHSAL